MKPREEILLFCRESLGLPASVPLDVSPLPGRGSERAFYRVRWSRKESAVLVHYDPNRVENALYAPLAVFLREKGIPVPCLIRHDPAACLLLLEDLGDKDLWSFRQTPWEERSRLYRKTLAVARRLHSLPEGEFPAGRVRLMESFGPGLYRWERDYFRENFVRNVCGLELSPGAVRELEAELSALADRLSGSGRCLVHRDLQSRNVMVREDEPFLIDFQGMRFGSPFYDLASLLCDPYVEFEEGEREELLEFYHRMMAEGPDLADFRNSFWEASAQRLMQALGAYGFLGLRKGLKDFLEPIPAALHNLRLAASQTKSLSRLLDLSLACGRAVEQRGSLPGIADNLSRPA